jgi:hypothetical protein
MPWPNFFPDGCPPIEAWPATGVFYRLVEPGGPSPRDFLSRRELRPDEPVDHPCEACGLSGYRDPADFARLRRRFPPLRRKRIARGELHAGLGLMKKTFSDSHHTWWVMLGSQPWTCFEIVPEESA